MTTGERMKQRRKELGISAETVAAQLGVSPATIYRYEKGDIEKIPVDSLNVLARILETTPAFLMGWEEEPKASPADGTPLPQMKCIPLVGRIVSGESITAEQNIEGQVEVPADALCDFALLCPDAGLSDAGIHSGDTVYICIQPEVENGQLAAVRAGDEVLLRRVYLAGGTLTLMPANAAYAPQVYTGAQLDTVRIEGRVAGYTHWIG